MASQPLVTLAGCLWIVSKLPPSFLLSALLNLGACITVGLSTTARRGLRHDNSGNAKRGEEMQRALQVYVSEAEQQEVIASKKPP